VTFLKKSTRRKFRTGSWSFVFSLHRGW